MLVVYFSDLVVADEHTPLPPSAISAAAPPQQEKLACLRVRHSPSFFLRWVPRIRMRQGVAETGKQTDESGKMKNGYGIKSLVDILRHFITGPARIGP